MTVENNTQEIRNTPAFPSDRHKGLTKREYFAGIAMQGILSNSLIDGPDHIPVHLVKAAIKHADTLLEELSRV